MILPVWFKPACAAVALAAAFSAGFTVNGWRWQAKQADALREAEIAFQRQLDRQNEKATKYEGDREAARVESRARQETIREIYRDVPVPAECEPTADTQRVLDDALDRANSRASGQSEG